MSIKIGEKVKMKRSEKNRSKSEIYIQNIKNIIKTKTSKGSRTYIIYNTIPQPFDKSYFTL